MRSAVKQSLILIIASMFRISLGVKSSLFFTHMRKFNSFSSPRVPSLLHVPQSLATFQRSCQKKCSFLDSKSVCLGSFVIACSLNTSVDVNRAYCEAETLSATTLSHKIDFYNGVIIDPSSLPEDTVIFRGNLALSLNLWELESRKGVWLKIPLARSALVPEAAAQGFEFHHANQGYVMMTKWLPRHLPNTLPEGASHQIGVGAFVINSKNEILAVKEKTGVAAAYDIWKIPTGIVHKGEQLPDAAAREVLEETGVQTKFESVIAFRHSHGFSFGVSDMFFILRMAPETFALQPQLSEIAEARWLPISDYVSQEQFQKVPLHIMLNEILLAASEGKYEEIQMDELDGFKIKPDGPKSMLYHSKL